MAKKKAAFTQHNLTQATKAFNRAGFPPHRAKITSKDVTIFFTRDIEDDIFERHDAGEGNTWDDA